jgi:hypothetical protein
LLLSGIRWLNDSALPTAIAGQYTERFPAVSLDRNTSMSRFLFGMVTGAVLLFVAMHYHVVHGQDGVYVVPKISNNLSDIYVDTREYGLDDWKSHKPLAAAIMKSDQAHLLDDSSLNSFRDRVGELVQGLFSDR